MVAKKSPKNKNSTLQTRVESLFNMVGATGFEPATPCAQGRCATKLRYAPIRLKCIISIPETGSGVKRPISAILTGYNRIIAVFSPVGPVSTIP